MKKFRTSAPRLLTLLSAFAVLLPLRAVQLSAQTVNAAQQVAVQGLLSSAGHGSFKAATYLPDGSLVLLADQGDGIRLLKANAGATALLAQAHTGGTGDSGSAIAVDTAGNIYVTGTTLSGTLSGTGGAAFPSRADTWVNSFLAKFDSGLNLQFLTFLGSGRTAATAVAATADAAFVTGVTYNTSFPVTPSGIQQTPARGTMQNGFVERFSADGSHLVYATYLTGVGGDTTPAGIATDSADNAYIDGSTAASGYPTVQALQPRILAAPGSTSGFLSRLTPAGDGFVFSTFIAGAGLTSLALDASSSSLLLSGNVSLGQFPVATAAAPVAPTEYQTLLRIPTDGQTVTTSVLLVPGTTSYVTAGPSGAAWVSGSLTVPLFPGLAPPDDPAGDSFLLHVTSTGVLDQTLRFGATSPESTSYTTPATTPGPPAVSADGATAVLPATLTLEVSAALAASERFELPLAAAPNSLLPSTLRDVVQSCTASQCTATAGLLALVKTGVSAPVLAFSADTLPQITLRNLGSATANGLALATSGYTLAGSNCGPTLEPSNQCSLLLAGTGPGTLTASAGNAPSASVTLPASTAPGEPLALSTPEVDFGIVTPSGAITRTFTVTNLSAVPQTFASTLNGPQNKTYTVSEIASDCPGGAVTGTHVLAAGASCSLTLALAITPSATPAPVHLSWLVGTHELALTAFPEPSDLSVSTAEIDFGTVFSSTASPHLPRFLFLSNNSSASVPHTPVVLPLTSAFSVSDECPSLLEPRSVCRLSLAYSSPTAPSTDATTLTVDGLSVFLTGTTLQPASVTGSTSNPSLAISPGSLTFGVPVFVSGVSTSTQQVTLTNTGSSALPLAIGLSGDFALSNGCPSVLAAGASCALTLAFAPSQPGTRNGLLSITGGSGFAPAYVTLTGSATPLLPANNGLLDLGQTYAGEPLVAWYKVQQSVPSLTVSTSSPAFAVALVPDNGSGHGTLPSSSFSQTVTGTCGSCWLGVQFLSPTPGSQSATLSLATQTGGVPYTVSLTAVALPVRGLLLTPLTDDFGSATVGSSSPTHTFTFANLLTNSAAANIQSITATGDFALVPNALPSAACGTRLVSTAACTVQVDFTPTATGLRTGMLTIVTDAGSVSATLLGYGETDPGIVFNPSSLLFDNVPGTAATQQTITVHNTSAFTERIGTIASSSAAFAVSSTCGTLPGGAQCTITVNFTPQFAVSAGLLSVPVTTTINGQPLSATYTIPLRSTYAASGAGLTIVPGQANFGAQNTGTLGLTREFTLFNFSSKTVNVQLSLPRQFPLADPGACASLAPNSNCVFSVSFLPAVTGEATGTVTATGVPTDGSPALSALAYMIGFGQGAGTLALTGNLIPNSALDFGQLNSGQTAQQVLTLTNTGATPVTVRRITSEPPFLSTTTCGLTLAAKDACTVTLTYAAVNEVATLGSAPTPRNDTGELIVESDAALSPITLQLTGQVQPAASTNPASSTVLATYSLSQSALTFSNTTIGNASATQTLTVTSTGNRVLHITHLFAPADFTANPAGCDNVQPGGTCTLAITFNPTTATAATVRPGALEISSDAAVSLEFVSLLGVSSPSPLTLNPTALDFGTVNVGASSKLSFTVTNTLASPVTFLGLSASGDYSAGRGTCPANGATLAAGSSCTIVVTFSPTASGTRTGQVSLSTDATQLPLTVSLIGVGALAHLTATPSALAFGSIAVGSPAGLPLNLLNAGTAMVTGITTTIVGPDAADFAVTVPCPTLSLAANQGCTLTVTFTPSRVGPESATLQIASSDPASPLLIPLTGSGSQPGGFVLTVDGGSSATVTVKSGTPAVYTLQLTPVGGFSGTVALTCKPVVPAQWASCSLADPLLTLNGTATQTSMATINTVTEVPARTAAIMGMLLLLPWWRKRTTRRWVSHALIAIAGLVMLLGVNACGGGKGNPNLRYTPPGTYQYTVTASSTSGPAFSQSVTLNLIVQ